LGELDLSTDQLIFLCETAEKVARASIFKRVSKQQVRNLDISVEIEPADPLTVNVEIGLTLSPSSKHVDVNALVKEAVKSATRAVDKAVSSFRKS
jgi:hypothetical protein